MAFKHGHYIDSGLSPEEREKACISAEEENKKLIKITISVDKQKSRCYLSICKVLALKNKEC